MIRIEKLCVYRDGRMVLTMKILDKEFSIEGKDPEIVPDIQEFFKEIEAFYSRKINETS